MRSNPDIETVLRPKISRLEHTVVSQDEVIAGLTQELSDLKDSIGFFRPGPEFPRLAPTVFPTFSLKPRGMR
jgi:hypothetical protein